MPLLHTGGGDLVLIHDVNINCKDTAHLTVQVVAAILLVVIGIGKAVYSQLVYL